MQQTPDEKPIPKKLIEKKVSKILQKRQRDGVIGTRESAEEEAKKSLQSSWSRTGFIISLWMSNIAFTTFWKWTGIGEKKGWDCFQLGISILIPILIWQGTKSFNEKQQEIATQNCD
jgi:hypothetical protein